LQFTKCRITDRAALTARFELFYNKPNTLFWADIL